MLILLVAYDINIHNIGQYSFWGKNKQTNKHKSIYLYPSTKRYCNQETWPPAVSEIYIYNKYKGFVFNQEASSQLALKTKTCQVQ